MANTEDIPDPSSNANYSTPLRTKDVVKLFGFSEARAKELIRAGMPLGSVEEAVAWRQARMARAGNGGKNKSSPPSQIILPADSVVADSDFTETVNRHRELKEAARQRYIYARDAGLPDEPKLYTTYQSILKTLVVVEKEALARKLESRELIKTSSAHSIFSKLLSEIKTDLLSLGLQVAPIANPDAPGTALKIIDETINKLLLKWSNHSADILDDTMTPAEPQADVGEEAEWEGEENEQ